MNWMTSPAAKEWQALIQSKLDDPAILARDVIAADQLGITMDYLAAMETARQVDLDLFEKMASKLMTSGGALKPKEVAPKIILNLRPEDLDTRLASSQVKVVDADFEVEG